jgi:MFS family permease
MSQAQTSVVLSDEAKMRRLPWAVAMISLNAVFAFTCFAGPIFVLFLAELHLSKTQVGAVLACFPLMGVVALFVGPATARFGYKRSYMTCWFLRKSLAGSLLLTPVVLARWGLGAAGGFIMLVYALFALLRAIADTAYYPWTQDFVPDFFRGRFTALDYLLWTGFGFVTLTICSTVLARYPGIDGFMRCLRVGVVFGFGAVACTAFMAGGAPERGQRTSPDAAGAPPAAEQSPRATVSVRPDLAGVRRAFADPNFAPFLAGLGLMAFALIPVSGFLPLFAREVIGLSDRDVVLLQSAALLGSLLSSYAWGLVADRLGSKPVMLAGAVLSGIVPLLWLAVPRNAPAAALLALGLALLAGLVTPAWPVGSGRILFIELMPPGQRGPYTAVYYAWVGLTGAVASLLSGRVLDFARGLAFDRLLPELNGGLGGYALLFCSAALLAFASLLSLGRIGLGQPPAPASSAPAAGSD